MIIGQELDRTLEIINDLALESPRYEMFISSLPTGEYYATAGHVIPKRSSADQLRLTAADAPSSSFTVSVNGVQTRTIITDGSGIVEFSELLAAGTRPGLVTITVTEVATSRALIAYLTVANYAVWDAALTDAVLDVDGSIQDIQEDTFLNGVDAEDIEQKFGRRIATPRADAWSLDVYKDILNEVFQAYDIFSGTQRGLEQVIGAVTQVPPFDYSRFLFGPRWVLGFQYLENNEFVIDTDSDGIPDDWYVETAGTTMAIDTAGVGLTNLFADQRLKVTAAGVSPEAVFSISLPLFSQYLGFSFTASAWVESAGSFSIVVGISDDGGVSWTESAPVVTTTSPQFLSVAKIIDPAAPDLRVRLRQTGSGAGNVWYIERAALFIPDVTALYLGRGTIPRSIRDSKLGRAVVWWAPDELTAEELATFGLSDFISIVQGGSSPVGHVDNIVPAHTAVTDREATLRSPTALTIAGIKISHLRSGMPVGSALIDWDTTLNQLSWREFGEVGLGTPVTITQSGLYVLENVAGLDSVVVSVDFALLDPAITASNAVIVVSTLVGTMESADWSAGSVRTNLAIVSRTPDRFSFLEPELISAQSEVVSFSTITSQASLSVDSTEDQAASVLFEDGVAVPNTGWAYVNETAISIVTLNPLAEYEFRYEVLLEFETAVIDLGVNFASFVWFFDCYAFERFEKATIEVDAVQELIIDPATLQADLRFRSTEDQETSVLKSNVAGIESILPSKLWQYLDATTVVLLSTGYDQSATYSLNFKAEKMERIQVPRLEFTISSSPAGVVYGPYTSISRGDAIDASNRYHKINVKCFGVLDVGDVKIRSLVIKGFTFINDSI